MQNHPEESQDLLQTLYPLLGGADNVATAARRGHLYSIMLKDQGLADPESLADLPFVSQVSLQGGRLKLALTEEAYQSN